MSGSLYRTVCAYISFNAFLSFQANKWCTRGVNLLAGQQIEKYSSPTFAQAALSEIEYFLESSNEFNLNDPKEIHLLFKGVITPESRALVQQVNHFFSFYLET